MRRRFQARLFTLLALCVAIAGCKQSTEKIGEHTKVFEIKGTVVATNVYTGEVTLQHEAIPGFMAAMTMPYRLMSPSVVNELHPGDRIRARLQVEQTSDGDYRSARLDEIAVIAQARPNFKPTSNYHVPTPGDAVPNFQFIDQSSSPIQLAAYRGKALLLTFIYTRCPLNDFCPRLSRNFAAIDKTLRADPGLYPYTALLSISFDPVYDKPAILHAYGLNYTGAQGFDHWKFAAPQGDSLPAIEQFFNLGATPGEAGTITHSLSTVLIAPDGKIAAWYPGSEWSPDEVIAKMRSLVLAAEGMTPASAVSTVRSHSAPNRTHV